MSTSSYNFEYNNLKGAQNFVKLVQLNQQMEQYLNFLFNFYSNFSPTCFGIFVTILKGVTSIT
jgi:hypothetical protein